MDSCHLLTLPAEMLDMIFKELNMSEKKKMRQTCKRFREIIDDQVRYRVFLNNDTFQTLSRLPCPLKVRSLVVEAFNKKIESSTSNQQLFSNVENIILAGCSRYREQKVMPTTRPFYYPYVDGGSSVERYFDHWMSMADFRPRIAEANVKLIVSLASERIVTLCVSSDVFADMHDTSYFSCIKIPNLKTLEITVIHQSVRKVRARVSSHIEGIFDNRFPVLKKLSFNSMCACIDVSATEWIKFYRFLTAHRSSLEELVLQHQFHFNLDDLLAVDVKNDWNLTKLVEDIKEIQLKRLSLVLKINTSTFATSHDNPSNSLEMVLLQNQKQLEVLKFDSGEVYTNGIFDRMPRSEHLKACSIHVYGTRQEAEDMKLDFLRNSKNLTMLQIVSEQDKHELSPWTLTGVENLPKSIEKLSLSAHLTIDDAVWIQNHFTNLIEIRYIGGIRRGMNNRTLSPAHAEFNNFSHFCNCINRMPTLMTFRLAVHNKLIQSYMSKEQRHVYFEVYMPFSSRHDSGHMQH